MWNWIKKLFGKESEEPKKIRRYRTYQEIEDEEAEIEELLILSDPSWLGDIARKHHG